MLQTTSVNMSETNRTFLGRKKPQVLIKSEERTMKNMLIYKRSIFWQKTVTATKHNCWNNSQKRESSAVGRGPWDSSLLVQTASIQHSKPLKDIAADLICQTALKSTTVIQLKSMLQYKKQPYWNQDIFETKWVCPTHLWHDVCGCMCQVNSEMPKYNKRDRLSVI